MKKAVVLLCVLLIATLAGFLLHKTSQTATTPLESTNKMNGTKSISPTKKLKFMKDVGEAYMDHFGLTDTDFKIMRDANIDIIEGNFDSCASDDDVTFFLEKSKQYGLKVVMPAGAGEAEWGYACDQESYPRNQKPVWQKDAVLDWVETWKDNAAVYAWDISNEAGSVFPNASWYNEKQSYVPDAYYITTAQLQQAYSDVKSVDKVHPIMIRMNGWFFYDNDNNFFRPGNPFTKNTADIVMINAYSNVEDYYPDFVDTVTTRAISSIQQVHPNTEIIVSLGSWHEEPLWKMPTAEHLQTEIAYLEQRQDVSAIAYFKYGAKNSTWYLPDEKIGAPKLLTVIKETQ